MVKRGSPESTSGFRGWSQDKKIYAGALTTAEVRDGLTGASITNVVTAGGPEPPPSSCLKNTYASSHV